jgi:hypothetical protein
MMLTRLVLSIIVLSLPVAVLPDQNISGIGQVSLGNATGKTNVLKTGTLVSTATTADQVLLTYTVTVGKTFYLSYFDYTARLTAYAATATNYGNCSLESPAGTKLYTSMVASASNPVLVGEQLAEPVPIASGVVVRLVCTPSAATSFTWIGNFGGYER